MNTKNKSTQAHNYLLFHNSTTCFNASSRLHNSHIVIHIHIQISFYHHRHNNQPYIMSPGQTQTQDNDASKTKKQLTIFFNINNLSVLVFVCTKITSLSQRQVSFFFNFFFSIFFLVFLLHVNVQYIVNFFS